MAVTISILSSISANRKFKCQWQLNNKYNAHLLMAAILHNWQTERYRYIFREREKKRDSWQIDCL